MSYYERDTTVAQSCSNFRSAGTMNNKYRSTGEGISCISCRNWNGTGCIKGSYDSVASRLGID